MIGFIEAKVVKGLVLTPPRASTIENTGSISQMAGMKQVGGYRGIPQHKL
jgi:hypothetical protein